METYYAGSSRGGIISGRNERNAEQSKHHEGDFLEISVGEPTPCYAEEIQSGIFLRKDEATDEVKSIGILSFKNRAGMIKDIDLKLPLEIQLGPALST